MFVSRFETKLCNSAKFIIASLTCALLLLQATQSSEAAEQPKPGIEQRVAWTTSRITGKPDPPLPYVTEQAFSNLKFQHCLDLAALPGSDRLFIVEQAGKIFSFPNRPDVATADLVIDFAEEIDGVKEVYAIAFHPDFERNRYCYVCYIMAPNLPDGTHVARFRVTETEPPVIDVASETTIITWLSGGHNGCCLKFGPDGYLYIATGDGTGANPPDTLKAGQDISELLSSILRIDVDHADEGKGYHIPLDNPFVDVKGARGEVWAYGLRNPWRMSFDRKTGDLWVGDVGWEMWEMLNRIERGGNYGWAVTEGHQSIHPEWPRGPTPILPPTIDHPHSESSSITDGLTYYGTRLKGISGTHIYGDYDTGKLWGFRFQDGKAVDHRELADTTHRIAGFGEDRDGEFYLVDHVAGTLHRLVPNPQQDQHAAFPRKLSESGLFSSVSALQPAAGVIPYSINAEPWADYAVAERLVAVPNELSINTDSPAWLFPKDTVLAKTLSLDMQRGDSSSRRRVETQILHFDGMDWLPYTYRWNDEQSDAFLVDAAGAEQLFEITDPTAPSGKRQQTWRFAGRGECQRCHNKWSGPALAFNAPQLNRDHNYNSVTASQLDTLAHTRVLEKRVETNGQSRLADLNDSSADCASLARAYLHANCAHCHRMNAGGSVLSQMQFELPLDQASMVGVRPTQGTFGIHSAQVIAPGDPYRSVLWYRIAKLGGGRMPHIGSAEVDLAGVELIHDWIFQMHGNEQSPGDEGNTYDADISTSLQQLSAKEPPPNTTEHVDRLLSSTSGALMLMRAIDRAALSQSAASLAIDRGTKHNEVSIRDLFERFLPAERRTKLLGSVVEADKLLSLQGDAARGEKVYFETAGVSCKNCHRIHMQGTEIGPELTTIGTKLTREQLLESILEPSKRIDPKYVTYLAETDDGRLLSGVLVTKDAKEVVLRDAQNTLVRIPANEIEQLVPQGQSLMPDLLVRDLTAQQVADLLAYLSSLK